MNIQQAKLINLYDALQKFGCEPVYASHSDLHSLWYYSPFREETKASFKVDLKKNSWFDFGIGRGGDLVNFVQELYGKNVSEALDIISSKFNSNELTKPSIMNSQKKRAGKIQIVSKGPIIDQRLKNYIIQDRRIPMILAANYCEQIDYHTHKRNYKAIGFPNDAGGYELRTPIFKAKTINSISTLIFNNNSHILNVFEGFFDFLSALVYYGKEKPTHNTIILNTVTNVGQLSPIIPHYELINVYLDNDSSGITATKAIQIMHRNVKDHSNIYFGYKDFNSYLTQNFLINNLKPNYYDNQIL